MYTFYPPISPFRSDYLKVSDIHTIYFEECGNPKGQPVVFIHGGPGGGCDEDHRRFFDPSFYRIILFDQRGCGRSKPFAELRENTTWDLVADMEVLRKHLGLDSWLLFGGSWGSTLALAYASLYAEKVRGLILRGIFLCRREELLWFYQAGAHWVFPDFWEPYLNYIPLEERGDMMGAYYKRLTSPNLETQKEAAVIWSSWEASCSKLIPSENFIKIYEAPEKAIPFARIECHYFVNQAFFKDDHYLLTAAQEKLTHLPCRIIQGRYDVVCPMKSAWELHKVLPKSELVLVKDAGHSAGEEGIKSELIRACEDFKKIF